MYDAARRELDILDGKDVSYVKTKKPKLFKKKETAHVPKGEFSCPVRGCKKHFATEDLQKEHVETQGGKGHKRYRREHHIASTLLPPHSNCLPRKQCHVLLQEQMDQGGRRCAPSPEQEHKRAATLAQEHVPPSQTDIRSFFQDTAPLPDIPKQTI